VPSQTRHAQPHQGRRTDSEHTHGVDFADARTGTDRPRRSHYSEGMTTRHLCAVGPSATWTRAFRGAKSTAHPSVCRRPRFVEGALTPGVYGCFLRWFDHSLDDNADDSCTPDYVSNDIKLLVNGLFSDAVRSWQCGGQGFESP